MPDITPNPVPPISHDVAADRRPPRQLARPSTVSDLQAVYGQWVAERTLLKDPAKIKALQEKLALR